MQITLNFDESLLNEAFQLTDLTTQDELIKLALQELVRSRRNKNLLDLAGQIKFTPDFDHKALRGTRHVDDWYKGLTVRSPMDCCIAQAALENDLLLIHNDRDFETIAQVRSLQHLRFQS